MSMFEQTLKAKVKVYHDCYTNFSNSTYAEGLSKQSDLNDAALKLIKSANMPSVTTENYAAAISSLLDKRGEHYTVWAGFALSKQMPQYNKDKARFNELKSKGEMHPGYVNYMYIESAGTTYGALIAFKGICKDVEVLDKASVQ